MIDTRYLAQFLRLNQLPPEVTDEDLRGPLLSAGVTEADLPMAIAFFRSGSWRVAAAAPENSTPTSVVFEPAMGDPVNSRTPVVPTPHHHGGWFISIIILVLLLIFGGFGAYAYFEGLGPFAPKVPYTEENIVSGLLANIETIKTLNHTTKFDLSVVPRDADAKPFVVKERVSGSKKPFLLEMTEILKAAPAKLNFVATISASLKRGQDPKDVMMSDWQASGNFLGQFDDLNFEVDLEGRHVGSDYYFTINKFPSFFFFSFLAPVKGKWVKFNTSDLLASSSPTSFFAFGRDLPKFEEEYQKQRDAAIEEGKIVLRLAGEEKLLNLVGKPVSEKLAEVKAYRYELSLNRETIISFLKRLSAELGRRPQDIRVLSISDIGVIVSYLESPEFIEIFDYLKANTRFFVWVNEIGMPLKFESRFRLVPQDESIQLAGKQLVLATTVQFRNINEPIVINPPESSISVEEAMKLYEQLLPR